MAAAHWYIVIIKLNGVCNVQLEEALAAEYKLAASKRKVVLPKVYQRSERTCVAYIKLMK